MDTDATEAAELAPGLGDIDELPERRQRPTWGKKLKVAAWTIFSLPFYACVVVPLGFLALAICGAVGIATNSRRD